MKKIIILAIIQLILAIPVVAQMSAFESDFNRYLYKNAKATKFKIKTITKTYHKKSVDTTSRVGLQEIYNADGNIELIVNGSKDSIFFTYNGLNLIEVKSNKWKCNLFESGYNTAGQREYIKVPNCVYDSLYSIAYYIYRPDGKVDYSMGGDGRKRKYHYDEEGKQISTFFGKLPKETPGDNNTKRVVYDMGDDIHESILDSLGNELLYTWKVNNNGVWRTIFSHAYSYTDTLCTEMYYYAYPYGNHEKSKGQLKLDTHVKYEYNAQGLKTKEIYYNRRGKVKYIEVYSYEFW